MAQHTPGPWFCGDEDETFDGVKYVQVHAGEYGNGETFRGIANVEGPFDGEDFLALDDETRANARLIAAAPDLFDVIEHLVEGTADIDTIYEDARAAIARAKGGAQ